MLIKKPLTVFFGKTWAEYEPEIEELIKEQFIKAESYPDIQTEKLAKYINENNPKIRVLDPFYQIFVDNGVNYLRLSISGFGTLLIKENVNFLKRLYKLVKEKRGT